MKNRLLHERSGLVNAEESSEVPARTSTPQAIPYSWVSFNSLAAIPDTFEKAVRDISRLDCVWPKSISLIFPTYKDTWGSENDTSNDGKLTDLSAELESDRGYAHAAMAETEALRKTIVTLADDSRMDYLLDRLLVCIHDVVPFDSACVLFTEQEGSPRLFVARESPRSLARIFVTVAIDENPFIQQIVVERKSILLGDLDKEPSWRAIKPVRDVRCWIGVPLVMHDCALGVHA